MKTKVRSILFALTIALLSVAISAAADSVFMAVDVSRSLDASTWRTLTSRVAADVASLPEGTNLNVTTFGATTGKQPLFAGTLDADGRELVINALAHLEPTENWTFFQAAFSRAQMWFQETGGEAQTLIFYSDGQSSLPGEGLEDLPVLLAADGTNSIEAPFKVFLWRPVRGHYAVVGGPGVDVGGAQLGTLEGVLAWQSIREARIAAVRRLAAQDQRARTELEAMTLPRVFIDEVDAQERATLGVALVLAILILVLVRTERFQDMARNRLPAVLTTPLWRDRRFGSQGSGDAVEDPSPIRKDPRTGPHLEFRFPGSTDEDPIILSLPAAGAEALTIDSRPDGAGGNHRCVAGIPVSLRIGHRDKDGGQLVVNNVGSDAIQLQTPRGNEFPIAPGCESEVDFDDVLVLPHDWSVLISPPRPQSEADGLLSIAS